MAIRFRHDAAAVVPPSNATTRKYGQQLVLQEQQRKYQSQQAGYDRLFDATKQATQNLFQWGRDVQQNAFQSQRDKDQNAFQGARDKALMEQRAQEQEAARQRAFMEDAMKQSSGMIMDDIKNGEYDPATARNLQQNLVEEAEALGNPGLDATQRAEALQKIRARRATLTANRQQKPPPAPPQPNFHTDPHGNQWVQEGPDKWKQVPPQEKKPANMQEYYNANEDKFQGDLDAKMQSMQDEQDLITDPAKKVPVTREAALEQMKKDYEFRQKALGRSAPPPVGFGTSSAAYYNAPDSEADSQAAGIPIAPPDPGQPPSPQRPQMEVPPVSPPGAGQPLPLTSKSSSQNPWMEATGAGQQSASVPLTSEELKRQSSEVRTMDNGQQVVPAPLSPRVSESPKTVPPDFDKLAGASTNAEERGFLNKIKEVYKGQPPEVQNAISVLINPDSLDRDAAQALAYLNSVGIDITQLAVTPKGKKKSNRDWQSGKGM